LTRRAGRGNVAGSRSFTRRCRCATPPSCWPSRPCPLSPGAAEERRGIHQADQAAPAGRADHDRAGRPPAASDKVPTPLKFFGHIIGQPGELDYAKDLARYLETLAKSSPRAKFWTIGKSEEGRDMVLLAIADEATIKSLDQAKANLAALTDPRATSEAQAQQLIKTAKPIYWFTSGMHSPRPAGPRC
jgi:hypothetical protein